MILDDIVKNKVKELENIPPFSDERIAAAIAKPNAASFYDAMAKDGLSIIGEVKKASPSRGVIKEDFDPVAIAKQYAVCVDAVSVLTDEKFFMGKAEYLSRIHEEVKLPLLRKDFVISPTQIYEAKELGASSILLIAAVLYEKKTLEMFINIAREVGLEPLVETHNAKEIGLALSAGAKIVGINNRNLLDFSEDIYTTVKLREMIPDDIVVISESSIHTADDIKILKTANVNGVLVGESFMRSGNIIEKAKEFRDAYEN